MNRIFWWLADWFSGTLAPAEREALLGDLAESRESGAQALGDVLGLVARRQQQLWSHRAPWFKLLGLILPLGMLLSILSRPVAGEGALYTWLYANNSDWALVRNPGFWYVLGGSARHLLLAYLKLSCWSWSAGFLLGWASRPINLRLNGILLCLVLVFGALLGSPFYFEYLSRTFGPPNIANPNHPANALRFYGAVFPVMVQAIWVAVPAWWGLEEGSGLRKVRPALRSLLWTAALGSLFAMLLEAPGLVFLVESTISRRPVIWHSWGPLESLQFVAYWPGIYLVAKVVVRSLGSKAQHHSPADSPYPC